MWMQILINAGFQFIGNDYMGIWKDSIMDANKKGFFESKFRNGLNYTNNPNSETGMYIHPRFFVRHAIKVFSPGLIKTEIAFIHRVIATIRPWREYCSSIERLLAIEEQYILSQPEKEGQPSNEVRAIMHKGNLHPALVWWKDNFDLLFDAMSRRYPINFIAYDRLLETPDEIIPSVLQWCNQTFESDFFKDDIATLDIEAAVKTVDQSMRTQKSPQLVEHPIPNDCIEVFDELYDCFYNKGAQLSEGFRSRLNATNDIMNKMIVSGERSGQNKKIEQLQSLGCSDAQIKKLLKRMN